MIDDFDSPEFLDAGRISPRDDLDRPDLAGPAMNYGHPCRRIWQLCGCGQMALLQCLTCRETHRRLHHGKGRRVPRMTAVTA